MVKELSWAGIYLGPIWTIGVRMWEGYQVTTSLFGLPTWMLEIVGLAIFFVAVIGVLAEQNKALVSNATTISAAQPSFSIWQVGLIMGACGVLLGLGIGWSYPRAPYQIDPKTGNFVGVALKQVPGKTFRNQQVLLDGHQYLNCTFENVTFVYNDGPSGMINPTVYGPPHFASSNPSLRQAMEILRKMGMVRSDIIWEWEVPLRSN